MKKLSIKEKSVRINIESQYYGTIAEIGGGQETARHLFQAGGASNTVAKSISAYDKLFSDHFYNEGKPSRYVAEERLRKMVLSEYNELITILDGKNPQRFFAFANTVETLNYTKTNEGNGWLGIAVEGTDRYRPNLIFVHIKLHENDTLLQQYTLGALGINLIYGGLFELDDPRNILLGLLDNLDTDRVEVDYVYTEGPDMTWVDNRLLNLMLVSNAMTPAIMFDPSGMIQQPGDLLYKKNVLLVRGYFRPINKLGMEFIDDSLEIFKRDEDYRPDNTLAFCEISLNYLMQGEQVNEKDFLHRVELLNLMGQSVMVSRFQRYSGLVRYFRQFKLIKLRMVVGLPTFMRILEPGQYSDLKGGLLEAMGALFQENVKIYLYPSLDDNGKLEYPADERFPMPVRLLWQYLTATGKILILRSVSTANLQIHTAEITRLIEEADDTALQRMLPEPVFRAIKTERWFDYGITSSTEAVPASSGNN
jgi:hypothetical protein